MEDRTTDLRRDLIPGICLSALFAGWLNELLLLSGSDDASSALPRLGAVLECLPIAMVIAEAPSGRLLFGTRHVESVCRVSLAPVGLDPHGHWIALHPDGRRLEPDEWPLNRAIRTGDVVLDQPLCLVQRDGSYAWCSASAAPVHSPDGRIIAGVVTFFEMAGAPARRAQDLAAERLGHLQQTTARLAQCTSPPEVARVVVRSAAEALGADAAVAFRLVHGGSALEAVEWFGLHQDEDMAQVPFDRSSAIGDAVLSGRVVVVDSPVGEALYPRRPEGRRWCGTSYVAVPLVWNRRPLGSLLLRFPPGRSFGGDDMDFAASMGGLAAQALDRAALHDQIAEEGRRRDEFLAMLAHELRNPLAPVMTAVELLRRKAHDPEATRRCVAVIERQAQHLVRMVDDLLDASRIQSGKISLRLARVDLSSVVTDAIEAFRPRVSRKAQRLEVDLGRELWLDGDEERLSQAISNLLSNAVKFTPPGGRIAVSAHVRGGEVVLSVADSGAGIAPELLPSVFEIFVQGQRSLAREGGGLGVGLTITERLVALHGGRIEAHSRGIGCGAEFVVRLPGMRSAGRPPVGARGTAQLPQALRVLVVEDNPDAAATLADLIRSWGAQVVVVGEGVRALEEVPRLQPHAVLIDIGLPGLNGYELARLIRTEVDPDPDLALVALTGYGRSDHRERILASGFDEHIIKPAPPAELNSLLRRVASRLGLAVDDLN